MCFTGANVMNSRNLWIWLCHDDLGRFVWQQEWGFFQSALAQQGWQEVLCLGRGGRLAREEMKRFSGCPNPSFNVALQCADLPADVVASAGRLPWRDESFDCVVAPHLPDDDAPLLLVLAELFRVMQPQGALLITGLNPHSVWRWWRDDVPDVRAGVSFNRLRRLARMTGWQVEERQFMVHLPPVRQPENWQLVETAGQLLWAKNAAVYGAVLSKQVAGVRLRGDVQWAGDWDGLVLQGV